MVKIKKIETLLIIVLLTAQAKTTEISTSPHIMARTHYIDEYPEYIPFGPHPLLDIQHISGEKELYVLYSL